MKVGRTGNVVVNHKNSTTYKKMNINEGPEKKIMMDRHGATLFSNWFNNIHE